MAVDAAMKLVRVLLIFPVLSPNSSDYRRRGHSRRRLVPIRQRQRFLACPFHPRLAGWRCSHGVG